MLTLLIKFDCNFIELVEGRLLKILKISILNGLSLSVHDVFLLDYMI